MNAPEAVPVAPALEEVALAAITPSQTNPRKTFDQAALDELAASIRQHGVMQPILVRPTQVDTAYDYELVAGERRFRAAKAAGLLTIPAIVRPLGDLEAVELQLIENLQREGLHELEEAEGYGALISAHKYTADQLAEKVGKSKAYIYARLKLTALIPQAREAFYQGKLNPSTALLLARVPATAGVQLKALKEITQPDHRGEVMPVRHVQEHLQRAYMLRLKEAPFAIKDAKLVAKAGACTDCPKRTGNAPELFDDVKSADVCTDPACYEAKRDAHYAAIRAELEAKGRKIIAGKQAREIAPYNDHVERGYLPLDREYLAGGKYTKVDQLLKKVEGVEVELIEKPQSREIVPIVKATALAAALKKAGIKVGDTPSSRSTSSRTTTAQRTKDKAERDAREAAEKLECAIRYRILDEIRERLAAGSPVTEEDGRLVALALWKSRNETDENGQIEHLAVAWGWTKPTKEGAYRRYDELEKLGATNIPKLSAGEISRLMIQLAVLDETATYYGDRAQPTRLLATAERHGVDAAKIRAELTAATKAAAATGPTAAPARAKKKPAKGKATK